MGMSHPPLFLRLLRGYGTVWMVEMASIGPPSLGTVTVVFATMDSLAWNDKHTHGRSAGRTQEFQWPWKQAGTVAKGTQTQLRPAYLVCCAANGSGFLLRSWGPFSKLPGRALKGEHVLVSEAGMLLTWHYTGPG